MFTLLVALSVAADGDTPAITGVVRDDSGRALAKATVFIRTAGPREGVGVL